MSDTPETDYETNYKSFGFYTMGGLPADVIGVEFARNLERERDAVEQEVADVRDVLLDALPHIGGSTKKLAELLVEERDKYQEQADALLVRLGATQERLIDAEQERNIAHKAMGDARDVLLDAMPHANAPMKILAEMIVAERDLWKENSQSNRDEYNRLAAERDELKCKLDEARSDLEFRRGLYKLQTEQLNNANLRVERTRAYLEEIKSERDLWKLEAERWREIK